MHITITKSLTTPVHHHNSCPADHHYHAGNAPPPSVPETNSFSYKAVGLCTANLVFEESSRSVGRHPLLLAHPQVRAWQTRLSFAPIGGQALTRVRGRPRSNSSLFMIITVPPEITGSH